MTESVRRSAEGAPCGDVLVRGGRSARSESVSALRITPPGAPSAERRDDALGVCVDLARAGDGVALAEMARALLPGPGAPRTTDTLVARTQAGEIVAYAEVRRVAEEVHVLAIAVLPAWRRCGIASALLGRVLVGARAAYLEVRESNAAGRGFYAWHGFEGVGRRRGYYADGEDALLMTWAAA